MATIILPNIPDVAGESIKADNQLRDLLIAIKITLEKLTGATNAELETLLEKNE